MQPNNFNPNYTPDQTTFSNQIGPSGKRPRAMELFKQSYALLKSDKELMLFPLLSGIFSFITAIVLIVAYVLLSNAKSMNHNDTSVLTYVFIFLFYLTNYYILIYFSAALSACVLAMFKGTKPTFKYGMQQAGQHKSAILGYALLAATVGLILNLIARRFKLIGAIVANVVGAVWSIATIFIAPVLITTDLSPVAAVKESARIFKSTWGNTIIGSLGFGLIAVLAAFIFFVPVVAAFAVHNLFASIVLVGIGVIGWVVSSIIISACSAIYRTALFHYAETKSVPPGFSSNLPLAVKSK